MDEIKTLLQHITASAEENDRVAMRLKELGFEKYTDLAYLDPAKDLITVLSIVQCRKLADLLSPLHATGKFLSVSFSIKKKLRKN